MRNNSGFDHDYDKIYDHNHDGHLDRWEQSEKDYDIEESVQWMQNHRNGSGGHSSGSYGSPYGSNDNDNTEGCCYLILIGIAVFLVLAFLSILF